MKKIEELITSLQSHGDRFPEEKQACDRTISWIREHGEFAFVKECLGWHITGSLLITNPEKTKVLLMFHKKFQIWTQFGWHCDGETDVKGVAIREFHEESGIEIEPEVSDEMLSIIVWDIAERTSSTGMYQPAHQHYDIVYLWIISEDIPFSRQESEVDDIRWIDISDVHNYVFEKKILDAIGKIKTF